MGAGNLLYQPNEGSEGNIYKKIAPNECDL